LFKLKLFWFYRLLPHQQTDENSILFSAAFMSRLVAPLYLNFLHVIDLTNTEFPSPFLSVIKTDPIREALYQYFPLILLLFCIFTLFNLANKIMKFCGLSQVCCTDDFDDDQIERGSELMFREREAKERQTSTVRGIAGTGRLSKPSARNYTKQDRSPSSFRDRDRKTPAKPIEPEIIDLDEELRSENLSEISAPPTLIQTAFSWFGALIGPSSINLAPPVEHHHQPRSRANSDESPFTTGKEIQFKEIRSPYLSEPINRPERTQSHNPFDGIKTKRVKKYAWEDSESD